MNVPKKILVATDFNDLATAALRVATAIAERTGGSITLLYADTFEPPAEFTSPQLLRVAKAIESSRRRAKEELERCAKTHVPAGVPHQNVVIDALPVHAISTYAETHDIDLIAMGTHGRGGVQRILLGSVAEQVMRHTSVPVLTVHDPARVRSIERIAATAGGREYAAALAHVLGATVAIIDREELDALDSANYDLIVADPALRDLRKVVRHAHVPVLALPLPDKHAAAATPESTHELQR
jgi:nucleotide-binding universal stress UspA family protein